MADNNTVARPYAQALFDIAESGNELDSMSASLLAAKDVLADGQLLEFLSSPKLTDEQRLAVLQELFGKVAGADTVFAGSDKHGANFLKLLLENKRLAVLPEIANHFELLKAKAENKVDVTVTSATALSAEQVKQISSALSARLGHDVSIETEIDSSLIGGAVITAGDVVIDGSTRARLQGLANALIK